MFGVTHKEIMGYLTLAFLEFSPISASYPISPSQSPKSDQVQTPEQSLGLLNLTIHKSFTAGLDSADRKSVV